MRRVVFAIVAAVGVTLAGAPGAAEAQESGWWEWALREVSELRDLDRARAERRDREERGREDEARRGTLGDIIFGRQGDDEREDRADRGLARAAEARRGPPFCRNGSGHPVHGREWCREKGFGEGGTSAIRWEERGWEDIILRAPRGTDRRSGAIDRGGLIDILGEVVFGRMEEEQRRVGSRQPLSGRWLSPHGAATVLQVRSGSSPVAELSDVDGDGRVDVILVPRR